MNGDREGVRCKDEKRGRVYVREDRGGGGRGDNEWREEKRDKGRKRDRRESGGREKKRGKRGEGCRSCIRLYR
eukprot:1384495-Amorphochlora_amoeboformis.AAC.1